MLAGSTDPSAHLAAIVSSSDDAIISKTLDGIIVSWNVGAVRLFGYTPEEAIGRHISLIIPQERLDEETYVVGRIRAGLSVDHYETVRRRKNGSPIEISLTVSSIHGPNGTILGASIIARDITDQRRLQRMAEEASRAKDQFLATLSHELRTPLNTVLGYVQMLRTGSLPTNQQAKALDVVSRNATALARLVDDVLDTSRIVTGKMHVELAPCDLVSIVESAAASLRPAADSKGVRLEIAVEDDLIAHCDAGRLGQVLWNLLSNAVKFTPSGGSVAIKATRAPQRVRITVEDTGAGIGAEELPLIFQRFWQGQGTSGTSTAGLGLGLALTRHLVELHGGEIAAHSDGPGRGARFEVALPLPR